MDERFEKLLEAVSDRNSDLELVVESVTVRRRAKVDEPVTIPIYTPIGFVLSPNSYADDTTVLFACVISAEAPSFGLRETALCDQPDDDKKCIVQVFRNIGKCGPGGVPTAGNEVTSDFIIKELEKVFIHPQGTREKWRDNSFRAKKDTKGDFILRISNKCHPSHYDEDCFSIHTK